MTEKWTSTSAPYVLPREGSQSDTWTAASPGRTDQRLIEVTTRRPSPDVAEALGLDPDGVAVVRRRLILLDGDPVELAESCYPMHIASGSRLSEAKKIKGGAPTELARLGYRPRHVIEDVEQRPADEEEAKLLDMGPSEPVLTLLRRTVSETGTTYEASLMVMKAPRRLRYELEVD